MNQYWIGIFVVVVGGIALVLAVWGIKQFIQQDKQYQKQQDTILQNGVCVVGRIIKHEDDYTSLGGRGPILSTT